MVLFLVAESYGIDPEPKPPLDSLQPSQTVIPFLPKAQPEGATGADSLKSDSLKSDSLAAKEAPVPYCSDGVRATTPPFIRKFGKVPFDRKVVTITDPVNTLARCCVNPYGEIIGAEVVRTSTIPLLDEIALNCATRFSVDPAVNIDEYVTSSVLYRVTFKPGKESKVLYGRYDIGELEFALVGPDTSMPIPKVVESDTLLANAGPADLNEALRENREGQKSDSLRTPLLSSKRGGDSLGLKPSPTLAQESGKKEEKGGKGTKGEKGEKSEKALAPPAKPKRPDRSPKKEEEPIPDLEAVIAVDQLARVTKSERVAYPKEAITNGLEGTVWIATLVDTRGKAREHRVWKTSGNAKFDQAALQAVPTFRFEAAMREGKPVMTWLKHKIEFRLTSLE